MKFRDPHGVIVDCTHLGWGGAIKDVVPADEVEREKLERRAKKKAPATAAE
jgi:copper oxidase (laccase) domain-containing protein